MYVSQPARDSVKRFLATFFLLLLGIRYVPSAAETHTGGGTVLGKPEGSPARRHSRKIDLK